MPTSNLVTPNAAAASSTPTISTATHPPADRPTMRYARSTVYAYFRDFQTAPTSSSPSPPTASPTRSTS